MVADIRKSSFRLTSVEMIRFIGHDLLGLFSFPKERREIKKTGQIRRLFDFRYLLECHRFLKVGPIVF